MVPHILSTWLRGLLAIAIVLAGLYLIRTWADDLPRAERMPRSTGTIVMPNETNSEARLLRTFPERLGAWSRDPDRPVARLVVGLALLLFAACGSVLSPRLWKRSTAPPAIRPRSTERVEMDDGHRLNVDVHGPEHAPTVVLIHGLGSDRTQWLEAIEDLSHRFRVIAYDLLGHGRSDRKRWADHSLEAMAGDLDRVMERFSEGKAVVVGHSMGGMIALTWCRLNPEKMHDRLAGLVLVHTTPVNPFETMAPVPLHRTLQEPLYVPLLRLTTFASPLVSLMNRLSTWNGSTHWNNELTLFAGHETREQLDRSAGITMRMHPATDARFTLAMRRFDVLATLRKIDVPTLVVAADRDPVTVPEASQTLFDRIPGSELLLLAPARHMGFLEDRSTFAEAVETFAMDAFDEGPQAKAR